MSRVRRHGNVLKVGVSDISAVLMVVLGKFRFTFIDKSPQKA